MTGDVLIKLITSLTGPRDTGDIEVTGSKVKVSQRWPCRSLVSAIARESLNGFKPKHTRIFSTVGLRTD